MVSFYFCFQVLLEVASTVYQIPLSTYRLNHAAFFANMINYVDDFLMMNHSGILGINPTCSWCFTLMMQGLIPLTCKSPSIFSCGLGEFRVPKIHHLARNL